MNKMRIAHRAALLAVLALLAPSSLSCVSTEAVNYSHEEVVGVVEAGSETYRELTDKLGLLTLDSIELPEFEGSREAFGLFFDSVLNYMSGKNYARYAGNSALIDKVNEEYPDLDIIEAIPASEFEATMYESFGGSVKLSHSSGRLFRYLADADVYVPLTAPVNGGFDLAVHRILETENTYRIEFSLSMGEKSKGYLALAIKRADGSCYFETLLANT